MQKLIDGIYEKIDELYKKSSILQGSWMRQVAEREYNRSYVDKKNLEKTNYQLRIELSGFTFRIRWFEIQFVKNGTKTLRLAKAIAVPELGKYKMSQFPKAQEWELFLIEKFEEEYALVRNQLKHLGKAHQSIVWASKSSNETLETKEIKYRVTKPTKTIKSIKETLTK
ncbi:hypothetical protein VA249_45130 (plasmid) [Vibrio alfacsensis]|uniref:conjugative transfer protein MobI(A/C) n=1 Tax=Vibrio alfacsensis TaxID=1074311 RepID=UPI001BF0AE38|nr:conjugative transfer protein MobI(A/C) [Vibrio alfacsensis]BBM67867.1 hypothetical protein VA249_45130 [Vibrio alfacsensis]